MCVNGGQINMKIAVTAESTVDLPKEILEKFDIQVVPFTILLGEEVMLDDENIPSKIFEYVEKNKVLPKTSAVNDEQYKEFFDKVLKNADAIIHVSLSSGFSSSYSNAKRVAENYPNVKVVDSQSLSTGIALLVLYAKKLVDEGYSFEDVYEKVNKRVASVQASFVLKRLDYLYKGGRCSFLKMFGANLLKLRPQIIVKDGKLVAGKKFRGTMDKCVMDYCNETLKEFSNPDLENVFITYSSAEEATLEKAKALLKEKGFKNIYLTKAQGTICSHCGEDCLGILYINDGGNY